MAPLDGGHRLRSPGRDHGAVDVGGRPGHRGSVGAQADLDGLAVGEDIAEGDRGEGEGRGVRGGDGAEAEKENSEIDGNGTTYGLFIGGTGVNISGLSFRNSKRGIGIISHDVNVRDCEFDINNTYGIEIDGADGIHIENSRFTECKASGIGITDSKDAVLDADIC